MNTRILKLVLIIIFCNPIIVYSQESKPLNVCNTSHRIAVIATGDKDEFLRYLQNSLLPDGIKLLEVKDEREAQQDNFIGILFLKYEIREHETQWMFRRKASEDQIDIRLVFKDKHYSSNWEHISEYGYERPGSSNDITDMEGRLARNKIPKLEIQPSQCKVSILISALKDEDWRVRREAAKALGKTKDINKVSILISALKDEDWHVRREAAEALGKTKDLNAVEPLIVSSKENDVWVRKWIISALKEITGHDFGENQKAWQEWWEKNKTK